MHSLSFLGLWGSWTRSGTFSFGSVSPPHSVAPVCPSVPGVHLSTLQPRTYMMSSTSSCLQQEFLASRGRLYSRRASHVWHIFSACCKQAHDCVTPCHYCGGSTSCRRAHSSEVVLCCMLVYLRWCFSSLSYFCDLLRVSCAGLWGVCLV